MVSDAASAARRAGARPLICVLAGVAGVVFLLVGVLGFIPGITTHYGDMTFAGPHSDAKLLGIFQVSVLHNLVHLIYGAVGLAMARAARTAKLYFLVGGAVYLVLWLYGLIVDKGSGANFPPLNSADDWLHFVLGLAMIAVGLLPARQALRPANE